ncbi:MAG: DNA-directed RNA polymerase subunit omega [Defluviicoccus sp.]|nr:DNA-directed RNA polymerase subunit omega [Defluviicoccus sp.]MDG4593594.1 DNA-directed RNA polymerase subunit omega [Defluviicoccus sp.]MDS4010666.1 DNA-directed RNA polymerase subunit omega [Defluviicoccus sp.]MDS4072262.1 DNA-directed RNA polymerase subunit omega [Defluviicoccus sp.]
MARVTVEDCVLKVPNRFELVLLAAQRSRNLGAGAPLSLDRDNDKNPVVALREIAEGTVELGELESGLIRGLQKVVEIEEPEGEDAELAAIGLGAELAEAAERDEILADVLQVVEEDELEVADTDLDDEAEPDEGNEQDRDGV